MDLLARIPRKPLGAILKPRRALFPVLSRVCERDLTLALLVCSSRHQHQAVLYELMAQTEGTVVVIDCGYMWKANAKVRVLEGGETLQSVRDALTVEAVTKHLTPEVSLGLVIVDNLSVYRFDEMPTESYRLVVEALAALSERFGCLALCTSWDRGFDKGYTTNPTRGVPHPHSQPEKPSSLEQKYTTLPLPMVRLFDAVFSLRLESCEVLERGSSAWRAVSIGFLAPEPPATPVRVEPVSLKEATLTTHSLTLTE